MEGSIGPRLAGAVGVWGQSALSAAHAILSVTNTVTATTDEARTKKKVCTMRETTRCTSGRMGPQGESM